MRRTDKQLTDPILIKELLEKTPVIHIAINGVQTPYILAINYVYDESENKFYIHSSTHGQKIDLLRVDPHVGFSIDEFIKIAPADNPCAYGARFKSAVGKAIAAFIIDKEIKAYAFNKLMQKFAGKGDFIFDDNMLAKAEIIELRITEITFKADLRGL